MYDKISGAACAVQSTGAQSQLNQPVPVRRLQSIADTLRSLNSDAHMLSCNLTGEIDRLVGCALPLTSSDSDQVLADVCELDAIQRELSRLAEALDGCINQSLRLAAI